MGKIVKYKLRYNRNNKKLKKGEKARVSLEVYFSRDCRKFIPTEVLITKDEWDTKERMVNHRNENHKFLNNYLSEQIKGLQQFELELSIKKRHFTPELLDFYLKNSGDTSGITYNQFFKQKMDEEKSITPGTYRGYKRALNKINEFNPYISFSDIDFEWVKSFDNFMIGQGLKINSRANIHNMVKKFLNVAIACGIVGATDMPYNTQIGGGVGKFTIPHEPGTKIPLTFEERERVEKLEYPHSEAYRKYSDAFLFMCYTGLRLSDVQNLNVSHLAHSPGGYSIDLHKMIKTKRAVYLELFTLFEGKPEKILRKYLKDIYKTDDYNKIISQGHNPSIFGSLHGPNFNRALKVISHDAKIQKHVTTHCGRHTFGTQMAILTNGNQYLIMDLLGHTEPKTTQVYIKLGERMVNKQLRNLNWSAFSTEQHVQAGSENNSNIMAVADTNNDTEAYTKDIYKHIASEVIKGVKLDKEPRKVIKVFINENSIREYAKMLPLATSEYVKLEKSPFEIEGHVIGMGNMTYIPKIEKSVNNHDFMRENCLMVKLKMLPLPPSEANIIEI